MNPLEASWARRSLVTDHAEEKSVTKPPVVRFEARGIPGLSQKRMEVPYVKGATLKWYLRQLKILHLSVRMAIYDLSNQSKGRLRLRYEPGPSTTIVLMPPGMGLKTHLQRSSVDAQRVAANMGKEQGNPAPRIVERKMHVRP